MPSTTPPALPVLALDTATETVAAGLQTPGGSFTVQVPGGALASAALVPELRALLQRAGLRFEDLKAIAFGRGPGAFTGLRTACAVAQGLGLGLGCPLMPLDSLLVVAEDARVQREPAAEEALELWVAMDARMDEIYAGRYRWQGGHWQALAEPALMTLVAFNSAWREAPAPAIAGSALAAFGDRLVLPGVQQRHAQEQDRAAALLRLAVQAVAAGEAVDAADALPLYLRDKVAFTTQEREAMKLAAGAA